MKSMYAWAEENNIEKEKDQMQSIKDFISNIDSIDNIIVSSVVSSLILDRKSVLEHFPFVSINIRISSSQLNLSYNKEATNNSLLLNNKETIIPIFEQNNTGNILPRLYNEVIEKSRIAKENQDHLFIRFTIVEKNDDQASIFKKTGAHITSGLLDFSDPGYVRFKYYCPFGADCPFDVEQLLRKEKLLGDDDTFEKFHNTRQDQPADQDGYCALYNHSMMMLINAQLSNAPLSNNFPQNSKDTMLKITTASIYSWINKDDEIKKFAKPML